MNQQENCPVSENRELKSENIGFMGKHPGGVYKQYPFSTKEQHKEKIIAPQLLYL